MSETPKPEQIQANVAAALSRLRGDVMPPITASAAARPSDDATGVSPAAAGTGAAGTGAGGAGTGGTGTGSGGSGSGAAPATPSAQNPASSAEPASPAAPQPASPSDSAPKPGYFPTGLRAEPSFGLGNGASTMSTAGMTPSGPSSGSSLRPSTATGSSYFSNVKPALAPGGNAGASQPDLLSGVDMGPPPLGGAYAPGSEDKGAKRKRNRLLVIGGAVAALVVIGAIWLSSGDSKQVPVITADNAPEKVKPDDAGGLQVPNQNVQVLENMNGQTPQQSGETVLPPPEQPITPPAPPAVTDTDAATQAANGQPANGQASGQAVGGQAVGGQPAADQAGQQAGLAAPSVPAVPDAPAVPAVPGAPDAASGATTAQAPAVPAESATPNVPATNSSQSSEAKPAATQTAAKPAEASKTATQPTATAGGKVKIQLAAVKTEAAAKSEWAKLQKAHPSQLGKLNLIVQKFTKDGTIYYRVQAGPLADRSAAKSICSELSKQKQACIVAR